MPFLGDLKGKHDFKNPEQMKCNNVVSWIGFWKRKRDISGKTVEIKMYQHWFLSLPEGTRLVCKAVAH